MNSKEFILDLGLMYDALQELSELSISMQERSLDIYTADLKIKTIIQVFKERVEFPGKFYTIAKTSIEKLNFRGVHLIQKEGSKDSPIDPKVFYEELANSMTSRLLDCSNNDLLKAVKVLNETFPAEEKGASILYGEQDMIYLADKFQLDEREISQGFREFLVTGKKSKTLQKLFSIINCISISSSECERGFSQMNLIATANRSSLLVENLSALLFIRIVGPPLLKFNPYEYVKSWLVKGRNSAIENKSRKRDRDSEIHEPDTLELWRILN